MAQRPAASQRGQDPSRTLDGAFWLVVAMAVVLAVLVVASALSGNLTPGPAGGRKGGVAAASPSPSAATTGPVDVASYLYTAPHPAPPIELTDPTDRPFSLASLRGGPALVFFGYTHCPDVCPATIGNIGLAMEAFGPGVRAAYVTVDPERDTTAWLREYVRFVPSGLVALTGASADIRATADAWGVHYARVEAEDGSAYGMSHSTDVYLVDAAGLLRAHFPFGTTPEAMTAVLRAVVATPVSPAPTVSAAPPVIALPTTSPEPTPGSTPGSTPTAEVSASPPVASTGPADTLGVTVVSSSVWSGGPGPVILTLSVGGARLDDPTIRPRVQLVSVTGERIGGPVDAIPVRPPGVGAVSYVATLPVPVPGAWRLEVVASLDGGTGVGSVGFEALDPGTTAGLGSAAPGIRTPTLDDVGGVARAVTTDPAPDLRLSRQSTADALAAHQPFVLVVDSSRFRVSPACGRAIVMARYLLDRWPAAGFIHLEPYRYSVVADTAVLDGTLESPTLTDPAAAWGIGGDPWGPRSMPWAFVVDGDGIVRAKYQGVMGTDDIDVILAQFAQGG